MKSLLLCIVIACVGCGGGMVSPESTAQPLCYSCYTIEPQDAQPKLDPNRPDCTAASGVCGCPGEPCCSDGCYSAQGVCSAGTCQPCGGPGQPCCLYTAWGAPFYGCNQWATQRCFVPAGCAGQACTKCLNDCGQLNEPCCPQSPRCALLSGGTYGVCNPDGICRAF